MEYLLSAQAIADLDDIADYISQDDGERAVAFVAELTERFDVVAERPLSFPTSADLPAEYRSSLHGKYRIIFEMIEGIPHILRVLHGARDIGGLF
ncbi:MAG: type II toxin-antitoxin system RelE/ParE family toxin [Sphingomonadales bacterium]|nr:type II toxin-antitoxin system RelE/ParE family toxin [Sphingomonadales bacterium]